MSTQVQFRRGTTAETAAFTGALGEVTVDTTKSVAVVHNGSTPGGVPLLREDFSNGLLSPGSLGSPSLKFANSSNTGFYSPATGTIALVASGIAALVSDTAGNLSSPGNYTASGRVTGTALIPTGSSVPSNGIYLSSANTVSIATNGSQRFSVDATGNITITGGLSIGSSFSATSFVPTGSTVPTNGMYLSAANEVSIATNSAVKATFNSAGDLILVGGLTVGTTFSAPTLSPTSNVIPANGVYLPTTNTLGFSTNTTAQLTIGSTGNVTIVNGNLTTSLGSSSAQSFIPTGSSVPANGMYLSGTNTVAFATNSGSRLTINATGDVTVVSGSVTTSSGSNTAQSFIPSGSAVPTNGMYLSTTNTVAFATNSVAKITIGPTNTTIVSGSLITSSGSNTAQSFIPTGSSIPTNGVYLPSANTVGISTNGINRFSLDTTTLALTLTGALTLPVGTTGDRPSGTTGQVRFNSSLSQFEGYDGSSWGQITSGACSAWVNFDGSGAVPIRSSYNVTSITDNGTGVYTVNFTNALANANYATLCTASKTNSGSNSISAAILEGGTYTASAVQIFTEIANGTNVDPDVVCVAVFR